MTCSCISNCASGVHLFFAEVELEPIRVPLRVVEVRGPVSWKLTLSEGSLRPGDTLVAGMTVYLEPGAVVICDDGSGSPPTFSAGEKPRSISFIGAEEEASLSDTEQMVPIIREGFEKLIQLEAVDPATALVAMAHSVSRPSVQTLMEDFDLNALALLSHADRTQLRVVPILTPDSHTLLVASDEWTPAKVLKVMDSTNRGLSLALLTTPEFEQLILQIDGL